MTNPKLNPVSDDIVVLRTSRQPTDEERLTPDELLEIALGGHELADAIHRIERKIYSGQRDAS